MLGIPTKFRLSSQMESSEFLSMVQAYSHGENYLVLRFKHAIGRRTRLDLCDCTLLREYKEHKVGSSIHMVSLDCLHNRLDFDWHDQGGYTYPFRFQEFFMEGNFIVIQGMAKPETKPVPPEIPQEEREKNFYGGILNKFSNKEPHEQAVPVQ